MVCALTKVITGVLGWVRRPCRTWLGLYLDKRNSFSSESSLSSSRVLKDRRGVYPPRGHGAFPPRWPDGSPQFLQRCMECRRGIAMRKLSVYPSVCLFVKRVHCDKTEERSIQIFIPYERLFSLVFWEECLVGTTHSTWNFGSTGPRWSEIADFQPIFARSASAVTPSEKKD